MRPYIITTLVLLMAAVEVSAQTDRAADEAAIRAVFERMEVAWTRGDGQAWGEEFAEDGNFTVWFGLQLEGREEIAAGHAFIFAGIYAGTTFHLTVKNIRFLGDDVAVVQLDGRVTEADEAPIGEADAVPLAVLKKGGGDWEIVFFQNTPQIVEEFRENGDLRRFKALLAELDTG
jgi:uncharacterized protein (TIGR02246 family)